VLWANIQGDRWDEGGKKKSRRKGTPTINLLRGKRGEKGGQITGGISDVGRKGVKNWRGGS